MRGGKTAATKAAVARVEAAGGRAVMAKLEEALAAQLRDQPPDGPGLVAVTRETLGRLVAIEAAANALLDAYGPAMAGLEDATPEVQRAAERLGIVLARGRLP